MKPILDSITAYEDWLATQTRVDVEKMRKQKGEKISKGGAFALMRATFHRWVEAWVSLAGRNLSTPRPGQLQTSSAMKPILILLATSCILAADPAKLDVLTTTDGKTYKAVTVTKVLPDEISITHESGLARIPFEKLPPEIQKQLGGFDPATAQKARADREAATEKAEAAMDKELSEAKSKEAKEAAMKAMRERLKASAISVSGNVQQIVSDGVLTDFGLLIGHPLESSLVDGDFVSAMAAPVGRYQYTTALGATATVRKWIVVDVPKAPTSKPAPKDENPLHEGPRKVR